jgi:hypothetical protein
MADAKGWSFIAREKGSTRVRAFDRGARGAVPRVARAYGWNHETGSSGAYTFDRERAKAEAEALALAFRRHERAPRAPVTLGALFASYLTEVTPGKELTSR